MHIALVLAFCAIGTNAAPQYAYEANSISSSGLQLHGGINGIQLAGAGSVAPALGVVSGNGNIQSYNSAGRGGDKYLPPQAEQQAPIIYKQYYTISAPEDRTPKTKHLVLGKPQKNYRVIFIKAPHTENVKYSAELAPQEEKTVIYVLHKKDEDIDSTNLVTPAPTVPSKPEVFFITYKTPEEAHQAQKEIQDQYDQLGGSNEFNDSTAPISSVIGSLDSLNSDGSYNYRQVNGGSAQASLPQQPLQTHQAIQPLPALPPHQPSSQYLPSFLKF
ncbi:uncharacterized protein [Eurosta solidaginis]|uniref:uncharacterized protein n=1 Tax=Eurosta solidaginis TaxID=178769 RepID=UPI0035313477